MINYTQLCKSSLGLGESSGNGQLRFGQLKESMSMDTRNKGRHVPSAACDSKKSWWLRNQHLIKKKPGTLRNLGRWTMKKGDWGFFSMTRRNLLIKRKGQRWSSWKGGVWKVLLEALGREDWKSALRIAQKRKVSWELSGGDLKRRM